MKQENLNTLKGNLTDDDVEQIVAIVGHGCQIRTKNALTSILKYSSSQLEFYGIYERLVRETVSTHGTGKKPVISYRWSYTAGQSYTDEIRTVRNCILGR